MTDTTWRNINLYGAPRISRVCSVYEIFDIRIPGTKFKIKVLERDRGDYLALLNVCLRDATDGTPNLAGGLGSTELTAVDNAMKDFMAELDKRGPLDDTDFEWSDPIDF